MLLLEYKECSLGSNLNSYLFTEQEDNHLLLPERINILQVSETIWCQTQKHIYTFSGENGWKKLKQRPAESSLQLPPAHQSF
jgi:hypothetical protein